LDQFVKQIVEVFKNKYASKLSSLNAEIAGTGNFKYDIDDQKLRLAFNNILNYLILTIAKPDISILLNTGIQSGISIDIKISGTDMELNKLYKIFEPFTTSQTSEIKEFNSSDLSLTLAHEYIKLNNGTVKVVSSSTSSCEIRVSFGRPTEVMGSQLSPLPKPTNDNNSILVIEDDYATSKLLSNYLTKWGYIPTLINTAEQTMDLIEKNVYLAIIMDIALPNINGLELLKQINTHPNIKKTPVIVCSIETEQQKAFLMGAVEYFVKPINYNYLVEILTSYKLRKESNILCVDDDVPTLNLLKQAVETAGFNALAEHISANVMESIRDKSIDLAIIDLDMPHPNGFELIKMIKSDNKYQNLPIIIYTGKDNFSDDLKQIDGMFEELLSKKSTNLEDLSGIISSMINRYEEPTPADQISEAKEGVKILFAEDYKHSQIIVTRLLKKNNFNNVVVVENGEEALKLASKEKFDLILMDMQMPIMNGFEATEKIKKLPNYQNTPIIALTAFAMKGDREKCLEAGATDYIPKPIDSKEFLEKVKYYTSTV
jgi:CheY-like chemotaxis protein